MKVGLIARSEDRGLGNMTWEWSQHMNPDRVLVVVPNHALEQRPDRYPGATFLRWDHHRDSSLDEHTVREWLDGLDVVYSAETFYDWRICDWARELGVRTVCHLMPEYFHHDRPNPPPAPDVWWTPTSWRLDRLPPSTRVVPVPLATERFANSESRIQNGLPTWLHIGGARAAADRNGTRTVLSSLRFLREYHTVRIRVQDQRVPAATRGRNVKLEVVTSPAAEYWELYGNADAMLLPRRYAGLSLPALESMAAGLALVMPDVEPQSSEWPIVPLPATMSSHVRTAAGPIPLAHLDPRVLAATMDRCARDPAILQYARSESLRFAEANSWEELGPRIRLALESACIGFA